MGKGVAEGGSLDFLVVCLKHEKGSHYDQKTGSQAGKGGGLTGIAAALVDSLGAEGHNFAAGKGRSLVAEVRTEVEAVVVDNLHVAVLDRESKTLWIVSRGDEHDEDDDEVEEVDDEEEDEKMRR